MQKSQHAMFKIKGMNPAQVRRHANKISLRLYRNEGSATPSDFVSFKALKNRESMAKSMTTFKTNNRSFLKRNSFGSPNLNNYSGEDLTTTDND